MKDARPQTSLPSSLSCGAYAAAPAASAPAPPPEHGKSDVRPRRTVVGPCARTLLAVRLYCQMVDRV